MIGNNTTGSNSSSAGAGGKEGTKDDGHSKEAFLHDSFFRVLIYIFLVCRWRFIHYDRMCVTMFMLHV